MRPNSESVRSLASSLMSWHEIRQEFGGHWVELSDIEWPVVIERPTAITSKNSSRLDAKIELSGSHSVWHPKRAKVRNAALSRHDLIELMRANIHGERSSSSRSSNQSTIIYIHPIAEVSRLFVNHEHMAEH